MRHDLLIAERKLILQSDEIPAALAADFGVFREGVLADTDQELSVIQE